ncbi:hypothetical protein B0F90DRAFT_1814295 [Multifurca ochricompacta]|uniref:Uncharacterized protein n=1 Tax=Multifurca ochricompacta TaxID=376703 RepID=A0AAD4QQ79_9AGAM|nr:hypothetical protein B0F90DRAFT_1814295 [Multifurca ochricompacta]
MSFPVQTSYPYTFHDSHLSVQSHVPAVSNAFSYPSPDLDLQHILDIPIGNHLLHDSPDSTQTPLLTHSERDHDSILSPVSVNSFMSPCHSPIDIRSPLDYPTPPSLQSSLKSTVVHTILPSTFPENHVINFDVSTHTFPKRSKALQPPETDPYAAAFLQSQIGSEKWGIFSARLYERRLGGPKARSRSKKSCGDTELRNSGACALDFLVKVEIVKEVLRIYVPHPYNPFKSLTHPYPDCPAGHVTLTRAAVLALSGWSNTQFSYWARRAEAICVLAPHDKTLYQVAVALDRRLRPLVAMSRYDGSLESAYPSPVSSLSSLTSASPTSASSPPAFQDPPEPNVTGKGLDALIDSVKRRTGASPFLRGKHASLDPFGAPGGDRASGTVVSERERKRRRSESDVPVPIRDGHLHYLKGEFESSDEEAERFPLSDSRSEKERLGRKRTRTGPM